MKTLILPILFGSILLVSCSGIKNLENVEVAFEMEKTPCFGECPTYIMTFYNNGYVKLEGKRHLEKIGVYTLKLGKREVASFLDELHEMNFCKFDNIYGNDAMDFPSSIIRLKCGSKIKKVQAITEIPPSLVEFIKKVDTLRQAKNWKKSTETSSTL